VFDRLTSGDSVLLFAGRSGNLSGPPPDAKYPAMPRLPESLNAWNTPGFRDVLKREIEQLDAAELPLQQGLTRSSHVSDRPFQAMIIGVREEAALIRVKAGIFYIGIIAGCSCADDPTPIDELNEYCVLQFDIDRTTADTTVTLLEE
jgi:hypothetical protein